MKEEYAHPKEPSIVLAGLDTYMQRGPAMRAGPNDSTTQIELSRLDYNRTTDHVPLLSAPPVDGGNFRSGTPTLSLSGDRSPQWESSMQPAFLSDQYREAPTHRPWTPSRDPSTDSVNLAGRGARRGAF
jgi:hypothetical protein